MTMQPHPPEQPVSLPPPVALPVNPANERLQLVINGVLDLALLASVVALALTKVISSEAVIATLALLSGAKVVQGSNRTAGGLGARVAKGGIVGAMLLGLTSRGGDS